MTNNNHFLDVTLLGKEYRVACPPDEYEALLATVEYVNSKLHEVAEKTKSNMSERIAVMAALNIAHEYLMLKQNGGVATDAENIPGKEVDISGLSRRIKSMEEQLDSVLNPQDRQL